MALLQSMARTDSISLVEEQVEEAFIFQRSTLKEMEKSEHLEEVDSSVQVEEEEVEESPLTSRTGHSVERLKLMVEKGAKKVVAREPYICMTSSKITKNL